MKEHIQRDGYVENNDQIFSFLKSGKAKEGWFVNFVIDYQIIDIIRYCAVMD